MNSTEKVQLDKWIMHGDTKPLAQLHNSVQERQRRIDQRILASAIGQYKGEGLITIAYEKLMIAELPRPNGVLRMPASDKALNNYVNTAAEKREKADEGLVFELWKRAFFNVRTRLIRRNAQVARHYAVRLLPLYRDRLNNFDFRSFKTIITELWEQEAHHTDKHDSRLFDEVLDYLHKVAGFTM